MNNDSAIPVRPRHAIRTPRLLRPRRLLRALPAVLAVGATVLVGCATGPAVRPAAPVPAPARHRVLGVADHGANRGDAAATSASRSGHGVDCSVVKCVALTFDDGPVPGTLQLLRTLHDLHVKATFFMVGQNAARHPDIVRRVAAEGHVIGNHSWDHPDLTRLAAAAARREISRTNRAIHAAGAPTPTLLRPPYGATNRMVAGVAARLGMAQILWNVDPLDWKDRNSDVVVHRVLAGVHNGSIILSHDIHATTRAAYPAIIKGLRAKGYHLVTVPALLGGHLKPGHTYRALTHSHRRA